MSDEDDDDLDLSADEVVSSSDDGSSDFDLEDEIEEKPSKKTAPKKISIPDKGKTGNKRDAPSKPPPSSKTDTKSPAIKRAKLFGSSSSVLEASVSSSVGGIPAAAACVVHVSQSLPKASNATSMSSTSSSSSSSLLVTSNAKPPPGTASSSSSSSSSSSLSMPSLPTSSKASSEDITRGPDITTEAGAKKLILKYLRQQNRPYSVIQIHENLHKRIVKPTVERSLTSLSEVGGGGGLLCKEYGKAKIYFPDQSTMAVSFSAADLSRLDACTSSLKASVEEAAGRIKGRQSHIAALCAQPSDDDMDR